ncbi:6259_t:CDS:2 [Scutellospora calospora]|uniref:6259_t:CDS:1 n=1 Tax=Scutellospora calospora TaxID=85575 RepID=A0ACA9KAC6_9GLOM|nr:6259_t:CDS:2 [Scutellospora calospora]
MRKAMETFKEVFVTKRNDVNSNKDRLLLLTTKTKVFLLQTFEKVYRNLRKSESIQTAKREYRFRLTGLNIMPNKKQMPLGFSSNHIPSRDECNYCSMLLNISIQNPINIKDLVEGNQESKGRKKTKDTDAKNLSSEDDILTQLEKDGSVLNRVEEACNIALNKFLKA